MRVKEAVGGAVIDGKWINLSFLLAGLHLSVIITCK